MLETRFGSWHALSRRCPKPLGPTHLKAVMTKQMKTLKYLLALIGVLTCLGFAPKASALLIGDSHELGFVNYGIPSGDADRVLYVNHLIDQALGTTEDADGQTYYRSNNDFGP